MNSTLDVRRERLLRRCAVQRRTLAQNIEPWRAPLALADEGVAVTRYLARHPTIIAVSLMALAALRPRRLDRWLQRGLFVLQITQVLRRN